MLPGARRFRGLTTSCALSFLVGLLILPQAAEAQRLPAATLAAQFKSLCLSTNADRNSALSQADKLGWRVLPAGRFANGSETYIDARMGPDARVPQGLIVSEKVGKVSGLSVRARSCSVMATVDDPGAVLAFAGSLVASIKPNLADPRARQWIYAQMPDGPREISTNAFATEVIDAGLYRELIVSDQQTGDPTSNTALQYTVGEAP